MYLEGIFFKFSILLSTWVDKFVFLCKYVFIIIDAIQINEKYGDIHFDQALGALCLACCDQGSIAHVLL